MFFFVTFLWSSGSRDIKIGKAVKNTYEKANIHTTFFFLVIYNDFWRFCVTVHSEARCYILSVD